MNNGMNRLFLIVGIAIAIVALMFLSQGIKKAAPTDEDLQQQAQQDAQKEAAKTAPPPPCPETITCPREVACGDADIACRRNRRQSGHCESPHFSRLGV